MQGADPGVSAQGFMCAEEGGGLANFTEFLNENEIILNSKGFRPPEHPMNPLDKPLCTNIKFRSVRVAERLALPTLDHEVAGSNPAGGEILPEAKRRFIAQSLSCSHFHRLEMTEILLKGRETLTHPSNIKLPANILCTRASTGKGLLLLVYHSVHLFCLILCLPMTFLLPGPVAKLSRMCI